MKPFLTLCFFFIVLVCSSAEQPSVAIIVEEHETPVGFNHIGTYRVSSITKIHQGSITQYPVHKTDYSIYSNGKEIRVFQRGIPHSFHRYEIYQSKGISNRDTKGNISIQPGLQARHIQSTMTKQLNVTNDHLTITQFPPISDTILITHAKRLAVSP